MKHSKKTDIYSKRSAEALKSRVAQQIKNVFVKSLTCIEIKFGDSFEGYSVMRAEILRAGNDAIRQIGDIIDQFNVEILPDVLTIVFKGKANQGEGNGEQEKA